MDQLLPDADAPTVAPSGCPVDHVALAAAAAAGGCPVAHAPLRTPSPLDLRMRRLLRISEDDVRGSALAARRAFEASIYISAARCLLTYIVLPFIFPIIGVSTRATPAVGISVSLVAMAADIASIRRFWRADHKYRWHFTALAATITAMMLFLVVHDVTALLTD